MPFEKGHTKSQGQRKPGGGRKKSPSTLMKEAKAIAEQALPGVMRQLIDECLQGKNWQACKEVRETVMGKAKQFSEVKMEGEIDMAWLRAVVNKAMELKTQKPLLLNNPDNIEDIVNT